jgi:aromatic ring-opening dioxygenase catalytic subunit (LigB family)
MAEVTGIFAASHAPPIVREWEAIRTTSRLPEAFAALGRRIRESRPDVLVVIGADHWANFFLDNMPAICIGVGETHRGPPERWLANYPHTNMRGCPKLAMHMAAFAFARGFEPAVSYDLELDHAFCVPLWKADLGSLPPVAPIIINALQAPLPTPSRCLDFGAIVADAIEAMPGEMRVAILATGGLSHSVGEPEMGDIDEAFDREVLALLQAGDAAPLLAFLSDARMARAGNGAAEVRLWLAAHGAARMRGFELIGYEAVPETYTGCGFAEWKRASG